MVRGWKNGAVAILALVAACRQQPHRDTPVLTEEGPPALLAANAASAPPELPGPADDRTPLDERPQPPESAQGAATVVETYFGLLSDRRYSDAWRLWADGGKASGMSEADFAASFAKYASYHAEVFAPGAIEGAAGSLYVDVPARVIAARKDGAAVRLEGPLTLRRVNDVPGSTPEQRKWRISASGLKPRG